MPRGRWYLKLRADEPRGRSRAARRRACRRRDRSSGAPSKRKPMRARRSVSRPAADAARAAPSAEAPGREGGARSAAPTQAISCVSVCRTTFSSLRQPPTCSHHSRCQPRRIVPLVDVGDECAEPGIRARARCGWHRRDSETRFHRARRTRGRQILSIVASVLQCRYGKGTDAALIERASGGEALEIEMRRRPDAACRGRSGARWSGRRPGWP